MDDKPHAPGYSPLRDRYILVVDDEEMVRSVLSRFLSQRGYRVLLAEDGQAALDIFPQNPIDLVLSDVRMPGLDGLQLLAAIKELNPRTPVVLISGYGDVSTVVQALKAGAENFLSKPLNMQILGEVIERSLALSCIQPRSELALPGMTQRTKMQVPSRSELVCDLVYHIALSAVAVGYAQHDLDNNLRLALVEALTNAMEHGNGWDEAKQISVDCTVSLNMLQVSIADQGTGFDHNRLPDPTHTENLLCERGRGIFLMRSIVDQVAFNQAGNQVTLFHQRRQTPSSGSQLS